MYRYYTKSSLYPHILFLIFHYKKRPKPHTTRIGKVDFAIVQPSTCKPWYIWIYRTILRIFPNILIAFSVSMLSIQGNSVWDRNLRYVNWYSVYYGSVLFNCVMFCTIRWDIKSCPISILWFSIVLNLFRLLRGSFGIRFQWLELNIDVMM